MGFAEGRLEAREIEAVDRLDGGVVAVALLDGGEEAGEALLAAAVEQEAHHLVRLAVEEADLAGVAVARAHLREGDEGVAGHGHGEGVGVARARLGLRVHGGALVEPGRDLAERALASGLGEDVGELVAQGVGGVARAAGAVDDEEHVVGHLRAAEDGGGVVGGAAGGLRLLDLELGGEEHGVHGHDLQLRAQERAHARVGAPGGFEEVAGHVPEAGLVVDVHELVFDAPPLLARRQVEEGRGVAFEPGAVVEREFPVVDEFAAHGDVAAHARGHGNLDADVGARLELLGLGEGARARSGDGVAQGDVDDLAGGADLEAEAQELGELVDHLGAEFGRLGGGGRGGPRGEARQHRQRQRERRRPHASLPMRARSHAPISPSSSPSSTPAASLVSKLVRWSFTIL